MRDEPVLEFPLQMRALIQRVSEASVRVDGDVRGAIGTGLVIFVGIEERDAEEDAAWLAPRIARMRIFPDGESLMNRSLLDIGGEALVISQFTLHARTKKGTRPSFDRAAKPGQAIPLYEAFLAALEAQLGKPVARGEFGADMKVALVNDGPVTIALDSRERE